MPEHHDDEAIPIGQRIRQVREEKKISLERVANETGCAIDYLKRIEAGELIPPVGTMLQISRALQIDSGFFLKEHESSLRSRIAAYTKRTDNYAYETLTPGAENKHLKAFRITIEAGTDFTGVGYQHEGEEFAYVLQGKIEITVGEHINILQPSESLHFNSNIRHKLRNIGDTDAELIVVLYSP
jgi:transcriptional regulator with XRE-family HTH domain